MDLLTPLGIIDFQLFLKGGLNSEGRLLGTGPYFENQFSDNPLRNYLKYSTMRGILKEIVKNKDIRVMKIGLTLFRMGGVFLPPPNELSQISKILRRPKACAF